MVGKSVTTLNGRIEAEDLWLHYTHTLYRDPKKINRILTAQSDSSMVSWVDWSHWSDVTGHEIDGICTCEVGVE